MIKSLLPVLLYGCFLPLHRLQLNCAYGYRVHPVTGQYRFHRGIDLHARNDTVYAITGGTAAPGYDAYLGLYLQVKDQGLTCTYGHLSALLTNRNTIEAGMPIGITGATGRVTGEHLHLSISYNGQFIDPLKFLYQLIINSNHHEQQSQTPQRTNSR